MLMLASAPLAAAAMALFSSQRRGWLTLWLAILATTAHGAQAYRPVPGDPITEPWRWRTFADMNGLEAQCVAQAKDGTIWFGTMDGASSYDGFEWKRHLASDGGVIAGWIAAFCNEPDGTLDAAGWWGISQFRDGQWTRLVPALGLRFADVRRLAFASDGSLWAATSWGALRRRNATWTLYTDAANASRLQADARYRFLTIERLPDAVLSRPRPGALSTNRVDLVEVALDRDGGVWFGTKEGEVLSLSSSTASTGANGREEWTLYNEADGLVSGRAPAILPLRDGTIWVVSSPGDQVGVFDGTRWRTLALPQPGVAPDGARLLQTRDGAVWVSARYVLYGYRDGQWHTYQAREESVPQALNLILESDDGALWLVAPNSEVKRIDYETPRWLSWADLNFQWESPAGVQWFLHRDGRVVRHEGEQWTSYGVEDGAIDAPVALLGARDGTVWVAGSHEHVAATARFDGKAWQREVHEDFSWGIDWRAAFESSDGSLWFGAAVDSKGPARHRDGILQFRHGEWIHHHQPGRSPRPDGAEAAATLLPPSHRPEPIEKYAALGESRDGKIWAGRNILAFHDGAKWEEFWPPPDVHVGIIEAMLTTRERDLWIGTRQYGVLRYDGRAWQQHQGPGSLIANTVRSLAQLPDGTIWAATDRGISRFDGATWADDVMPAQLNIPVEGGALKAAPSGRLWLNRHTVEWDRRGWTKSPPVPKGAEFWTVAYQPGSPAPRTTILAGPERVSHPGNLSILWSGVGPWRDARDVRLEYSFRLDEQPWSAFTAERGHAFFALPSGTHRFQVRARDQDFNIDPQPATLDFVVLPPVWRQGWFLGLMAVLLGATATQTIRVFRERSRLRTANRALKDGVEQLRESEQRFRQVTESMDEVFWLSDLESQRIIYISPAYERVWGRSRDGLYAQPESWLAAVHPDDRARVQDAVALQARGEYDLEYRIQRPDGAVRWIHARAFPIRSAEGRVYRVAGVAEDITPQHTLGDQLRHAQKMESLGTLAGGIAHDFNNILTAIMGSAEIMQLELEEKHPLRTWLNNILAASARARELVQQILTFGRKHESKFQPRKLQHDVGEALRLLRASIPSTVQLDPQIDPACPPVFADATQIHQVVMNLCTNAWHAVPARGGVIEVTLEPAQVSAEMAATRLGLRPGPHVRLAVRDNGCGMTPEVVARIFEPFFTTKEQGRGTGLGLAVVHGIVQSHHGAIFVHSAPGVGTCFEIFLPALAGQAAAAPVAGDAPPALVGPGRVLLVDDDPIALATLRGQLEHLGCRVTAVSDSRIALEHFLAQPASFDLVLTDNTMPGLSGRDLCEKILAARPEVPVLLASGFYDQEEFNEARALGVREILHKPVSLGQLAAVVSRHLRRN